MTSSHTPFLPAVDSAVRIPQHVVYRGFATETVVLNLETGKYHGVNPTGGRMLQELERCTTIGEAAKAISAEFDRPLTEVEQDLAAFCVDLAERALIEIIESPAR
jgi:hypothetical protein